MQAARASPSPGRRAFVPPHRGTTGKKAGRLRGEATVARTASRLDSSPGALATFYRPRCARRLAFCNSTLRDAFGLGSDVDVPGNRRAVAQRGPFAFCAIRGDSETLV